jgi:hypothetical protein
MNNDNSDILGDSRRSGADDDNRSRRRLPKKNTVTFNDQLEDDGNQDGLSSGYKTPIKTKPTLKPSADSNISGNEDKRSNFKPRNNDSADFDDQDIEFKKGGAASPNKKSQLKSTNNTNNTIPEDVDDEFPDISELEKSKNSKKFMQLLRSLKNSSKKSPPGTDDIENNNEPEDANRMKSPVYVENEYKHIIQHEV